jgi:hypothetical protein
MHGSLVIQNVDINGQSDLNTSAVGLHHRCRSAGADRISGLARYIPSLELTEPAFPPDSVSVWS